MKRIFVLACIALPCALATHLAACGGADTSVGDGGEDATTNDATASDAPDDTSNDAADAAPVDDGGACDAGCRACCRLAHPEAGVIIRNDEKQCACAKPGDCEAGAVCGNSLCADQKETLSCVACLDDPDAGDCTQKALAKCAVQPACAALETCIVACGDGG